MGCSSKRGRAPRGAAWILAKALALAALLVLVGSLGAAAPRAAPSWLVPFDISTSGTDALVPVVAMDPRGNLMAVWAQAVNSHWTVLAAKRNAGRPWSRPRAISSATNDAASPQLVIDGQGNAVAVWQWFNSENAVVQAATFDGKKSRWSSPINLSPPGRDSVAPRLAINDHGAAVALWTSLTLDGWTIQATSRPAGGIWEKAADLVGPMAGTASPDIAIDPSGNAVAAWASTTGTAWNVEAAYRPSGAAWSSTVDLSEPDRTGPIAPQVEIDPNGDAEVVWSQAGGQGSAIELSTRSATRGTWTVPRIISPSSAVAVAPLIVTDRRGDAAVVWTTSSKLGLSMTAVFRRAGAGWGKAVTLSGGSSGPLAPSIALDGNGNAVAVWTRSTGGHSLVQAASRSAFTGAWTLSGTLSQPGADALTPEVTLGSTGDGAIVWSRFTAKGFVVQGVGYDNTGPDLAKLNVPPDGNVGERLTFSVVPADVWSGIKSVRWSFGDGSTIDGKTAVHVYVRSGRFTVRVTATDTKGHATTSRRVVTITAG